MASSVFTWNDYPASNPAAVYTRGQTETRVFYFVTLPGKQVTILQWHTSQTDKLARWEWPDGKMFHGDVLAWASEPSAP